MTKNRGSRAELYDLDDRSAAIMAAAQLDKLLLQLLQRATRAPGTKATSRLFDGPTAPLGTFSSRILAAGAFGLITDWMRAQLDVVRKVRNVFAHDESESLSFEAPGIRDMCLRIVTTVDLAFEQVGEKCPNRKSRDNFDLLVAELCGQLAHLARRVTPMEAVPMTMFEQARMGATAYQAMQRRIEKTNERKGEIRSWYLAWGAPVRARTDRPGPGDALFS